MDAIRRVFGARVRTLREAKGWELDDLAARLGKSRSSMSRIETGKQNLTLRAIAAIATALDVSVPFLFGAAEPLVTPPVVAGILTRAERLHTTLEHAFQDATALKEALVPFQDPPQSKEQYSGLEESELLDDFFAVDAFTRCVLTS